MSENSKAIAARGTVLAYVDPYLAIGELTEITPPQLSSETIDVTNHQSPDLYREFIGSFKDAGEVTMSGNFISDDAGQVALIASFESQERETFTIVFPDDSNWVFTGVVTAISPGSAAIGDKLSFSATIKVSGQAVYSEGS